MCATVNIYLYFLELQLSSRAAPLDKYSSANNRLVLFCSRLSIDTELFREVSGLPVRVVAKDIRQFSTSLVQIWKTWSVSECLRRCFRSNKVVAGSATWLWVFFNFLLRCIVCCGTRYNPWCINVWPSLVKYMIIALNASLRARNNSSIVGWVVLCELCFYCDSCFCVVAVCYSQSKA